MTKHREVSYIKESGIIIKRTYDFVQGVWTCIEERARIDSYGNPYIKAIAAENIKAGMMCIVDGGYVKRFEVQHGSISFICLYYLDMFSYLTVSLFGEFKRLKTVFTGRHNKKHHFFEYKFSQPGKTMSRVRQVSKVCSFDMFSTIYFDSSVVTLFLFSN